MKDAIDAFEGRPDGIDHADVAADHFGGAGLRFRVAGDEIIEHANPQALADQRIGEMRSDKAGAARDQREAWLRTRYQRGH